MNRMVLLPAFVLLAIATGLSAAYAKAIVIALPITVTLHDPIDLQYLEEWEIYAGIYDTLVQYDVNEGFRGILAERWSFDRKHNTLIFKIRPGARFSDGLPLTAEDVAFSLRRIIFFDHHRSRSLTRCLVGKKPVLQSPLLAFPGIRVLDPVTLVIGPIHCGESLLNDLANADYGVISKRTLGDDFRVTAKDISSGLFIPEARAGVLSLRPNLLNWRWHAASVRIDPPSLSVVRFDRNAFLQNRIEPDLFRTSDPDVYEHAKSKGYQTRISLPIMTWYLSPVAGNIMGPRAVHEVLDRLNSTLDRGRIPYLAYNVLERPAKEFFPPEFNCHGQSPASLTGKANALPPKSSYRIEIVDHPSREGTRLALDLITTLRLAGYEVNDLLSSEKAKKAPAAHTIRLALRRQFLGDSLSNVFNMLFRVLKAIPDPENRMISKLSRLEELDQIGQQQILPSVCREFAQSEQVPIAHRSYAFIAKSPELLNAFSKVTGNLVLEEFPGMVRVR